MYLATMARITCRRGKFTSFAINNEIVFPPLSLSLSLERSQQWLLEFLCPLYGAWQRQQQHPVTTLQFIPFHRREEDEEGTFAKRLGN
jgi:hypothetical protein